MSTTNRSNQIKQALKVLRRHHKSVAPAPDRSVLEHLLLASCLENSPHDVAEKALEVLAEQYYDWNEVRVSSIGELAESLKMLSDPEDTAVRVKRTLQAVFESQYSFELDGLKKENLGQAVKKLERYDGTTPFSVAYVTQVGLGGHSIPVNRGLLGAFVVLGVVTDAEAAKGTVPGLERAIPKNKGIEAGSILHYLGVAFGRNPYSPAVRKLLLEIDATCKDRLPKRPVKAPPAAPETKRGAAKGGRAAKKTAKAGKRAAKAPPPKPPSKKTDAAKKKKKAGGKKAVTKRAKDSSSRKLSKRKPR